jgi:hypothetical protein
MAPIEHMSDAGKVAGDILSLGVVLGTLSQILPQVAALLSIVWLSLRIYDWIALKLAGRRTDHLDG